MLVATLNAEGQATIPGEIRRHLRLKPGDRVNFEVDAAGRVIVTAASVHLTDLEGCLPPQHKPLHGRGDRRHHRRRDRQGLSPRHRWRPVTRIGRVISIDTNVLVRFLLRDDPEQTGRVRAILDAKCTADDPGFVNYIVLCELFWVLGRVYRYRRAEIAAMVDLLLRVKELKIEVSEALELYLHGRADFADALIGQVNRRHGCTGTATFDRQAAVLDHFFDA